MEISFTKKAQNKIAYEIACACRLIPSDTNVLAFFKGLPSDPKNGEAIHARDGRRPDQDLPKSFEQRLQMSRTPSNRR